MTAADTLLESGRRALTVLDRALGQPPERMADDLPEAVRTLARLRNRLIDQRRADPDSPEVAERLDRVNAILSVVAGGEYPIVGIRRERIVDARDALAGLVEDLASGSRASRRPAGDAAAIPAAGLTRI
jgi:hypothetical protein